MGQYLIPNITVDDIDSAIWYLRNQNAWNDQQVWDWGVTGGVLFTDSALTDDQCAALYNGFTPDANFQAPLPADLHTRVQQLRDYFNADPTAITNAQSVQAIKDLIKVVQFLNRQIQNG